MLVLGIGWIDGKFLIDLLPVALLQESIGGPQILNGFEFEFFDEPVLIGAVTAFHPPFGLRRVRGDQADVQLTQRPLAAVISCTSSNCLAGDASRCVHQSRPAAAKVAGDMPPVSWPSDDSSQRSMSR